MKYRLVERKLEDGTIYYSAQSKEDGWFSPWLYLHLDEVRISKNGAPYIWRPKTIEEADNRAKERLNEIINLSYRIYV